MIAVDTNVLVRILVDDPDQSAQVALARAIASKASEIHVPTVVLVETVWVLESSYGLPKPTVLHVLDRIATNAAFELENAVRCTEAIECFRNSNADFSDCLILTGCQERNLELHTFDKRLGKIAGARLVRSSQRS